MSLTRSTTTGVRWAASAGVLQRAVQFSLSILLMRLLGPEAFGLIAMVLVFTGFASSIADLGLASAVVHNQAEEPGYVSTAFWLTLFVGALFTLIFVAGSPAIANFFHEPALELATRAMAIGFILGGVGSVPRALLQKRMQFGKLAVVETAAIAGSGIVGLVLALAGSGVWALVIQRLTQDMIRAALAFWTSRWRPRFVFSKTALGQLIGFGGGLTGFNLVNYWSRNADNLIIGRMFGGTELGFYSRAYSLMMMPLAQIMKAVSPVLFSALASIQSEQERISRAFLRVLRVITFCTFPLSLGLAAVAGPFVLALLGQQWAPVIPLLQILSVAGALGSAVGPLGSLFLAQGKTQAFFRVGLLSSGLNIGGILIGAAAGTVVSVAWGILAAHCIAIWPNYLIARRLFGIELRGILRAVGGNLLRASCMAAVILPSQNAMARVLPNWGVLGLAILIGGGVYLGLSYLQSSPAINDLLLVLRNRRERRPLQPVEA